MFKYVEGSRYSYRLSARNVGQEDVGSDGLPGDIQEIEVTWEFANRQVNRQVFKFPDRLPSGEEHVFPVVDHQVLSSGYAFLNIRLFRMGRQVEISVRDSRGSLVPMVPQQGIERRPGVGLFYVASLERDLAAFRARSREEVYTLILLVVAIAALLVNTVVAAFGISR